MLGSRAIASEFSKTLSQGVRQALQEKIPAADIRIPSLEKISNQSPINQISQIQKIRLVEDRSNGSALFEIQGLDAEKLPKSALFQTPYEAWIKTYSAVRRINPNTKIKSEDLRPAEVNVASGAIKEYRNVLVPQSQKLEQMQTKQTILENQYVITSAIEKQPDIRRGEMIKLELISGDLSLTTQALAEEAASVGDSIHVTTVKTKRQVVGKVKEDRSVEVNL
jgi:flagella basal body P-ring formation protein FlgA